LYAFTKVLANTFLFGVRVNHGVPQLAGYGRSAFKIPIGLDNFSIVSYFVLANPIGIRQDIAIVLNTFSTNYALFGLKKTTFFSAKRPVTLKSPAIAFSGK
jgi:hypothetical protein